MAARRTYKTVTTENKALEDIPPHIFTHRSQWGDFKHSLNSCGLVWGLPDWGTTILHGGPQWKTLIEKGKKLDEIFLPQKIAVGKGEEKVDLDVRGTSQDLLVILGMASAVTAIPSKKYCNLSSLKYEEDSKLGARQKLWTWLVLSLQGTGNTPGPFYYLTKQVEVFDIAGLYVKLTAIMDVVTICSLEDEVNAITGIRA